MKKIISKVAVLAFAAVIGVFSLTSCEKEVFEHSEVLPGGDIVIPGTDLTSIEALLAEIKAELKAGNLSELNDLIEAIASDNEDIKAQLQEIVDMIEAGQKSDAEIIALLNQIIEKLNDLHKETPTDPHSDPHSDPHGDSHGHGDSDNAGGGSFGK